MPRCERCGVSSAPRPGRPYRRAGRPAARADERPRQVPVHAGGLRHDQAQRWRSAELDHPSIRERLAQHRPAPAVIECDALLIAPSRGPLTRRNQGAASVAPVSLRVPAAHPPTAHSAHQPQHTVLLGTDRSWHEAGPHRPVPLAREVAFPQDVADLSYEGLVRHPRLQPSPEPSDASDSQWIIDTPPTF